MNYKKYTTDWNKKHLEEFLKIPATKRLILLPQCMRKIGKCRAKEFGSYYVCAECASCKISDIMKSAKKKGYLGILILKGGSAVKKIISELNPAGILGIACCFEGTQGIKLCRKHGIPVYFYPLSKDGCEDTDLELEGLLKIIEA
ncbi:MAG: hypothetical protein BWY26_00265 [Elusimicrobia bacterium ADurb.Bin231]|nr:MAG: hypothetical protein BWY26_00265 [Elusimicrobia bacterium ADurb.Bin231]